MSAKKRELAATRRTAGDGFRDVLREIRCFWTWPFGHLWEEPLNEPGLRRCANCPTWRYIR